MCIIMRFIRRSLDFTRYCDVTSSLRMWSVTRRSSNREHPAVYQLEKKDKMIAADVVFDIYCVQTSPRKTRTYNYVQDTRILYIRMTSKDLLTKLLLGDNRSYFGTSTHSKQQCSEPERGFKLIPNSKASCSKPLQREEIGSIDGFRYHPHLPSVLMSMEDLKLKEFNQCIFKDQPM